MSTLWTNVDESLAWAVDIADGHVVAGDLIRARNRLTEPPRVAIAGRVKAGKSTLLNALVGERLARTDASECTTIVTWFRHGDRYGVEAERANSERHELRFDRSDGRLHIHLDGLEPAVVDRINVYWPARRLVDRTLIDTPGMEGTAAEAGERTSRFFALEEAGPGEADAVIYLMRHVHASDMQFLDTFQDRSVAQPAPFNALAVLSRADELGAGRLDAMTSARSIADRIGSDSRVRSLCSGVVAVAGLLAETGVTLREDETGPLRAIAASDPSELDDMLLSVDHFREPAISDVSSQVRDHLLARFGMFGVRFVLANLNENPQLSTPELSALMVEHSGIDQLIRALDEHFGERAEVLKARSALAALHSAARRIASDNAQVSRLIESRAEAIEAGSTELSELRLWQLVSTGQSALSRGETEEVRRLVTAVDTAQRLGADSETPTVELSRMAAEAVERWRTKAGHPLTDRSTQEVSELAARSLEYLHANLQPEAG